VPLVTGISERQHQLILPLVLKLADDPLMHQLVTGMKMTEGDEVTLFLRTHSLSVSFGEPNDLDEKIRNFKAFYQKAKRDGTLEQYHKVDLRFGNQVVATKR
jgi:cell division protein FtsQ